MIKNVTLSVIFFIIVLMIPYIVDAGVIVKEKQQQPKDKWIDPNQNNHFGEYFVSKDGLICHNSIWQVVQNGITKPARKCQLPDGSWNTFLY
jgi:hypothetical protein|tara:strand:+ start:285 stop:560 length:276 start_codon:yes stop_codon:yes gene_type:complete